MFNELINKLNKVLNFSQNFQSEKVKDSDTVVEFNELSVGADVFISSPEGSIPAPDGDYKLDSGIEFKAKDGKISEVVEEGAKEEEVVVEELATEEDKAEDAPAAETDKEAELKAEVERLKAELAELKSQFSSVPTKEDLAKFFSEVSEEMKKLEAIPSQFSKTEVRVEIEDANAKYIRMAEAFSKK